MNENTLVVICAYQGDRAAVEDFMPWRVWHRCSVLVLSPEDSPITESKQEGVVFQQGGKKGWIGPETLERQRIHMRLALEKPFGHYMFFDADSVCVSPEFPRYLYEAPDNLYSNEVTDTNPGPSYLPKIACQPPYFMSRTVLEKLVEAKPADSYYGDFGPMPEQKLPVPTNCIDHFMLQLAHGAGVEHRNFFDGASFETGSEHGMRTMGGLVKDHGKIFLHSIKTKAALDFMLAARSLYKRG